MKHVYFDWNVFDKIEKLEELEDSEKKIFSKIEQLIIEKQVICPYSNAHIRDLLRGYYNNPEFIPAHLSTLKKLTDNLCIIQYWGKNEVTWHYRDANELFQSCLKDDKENIRSFKDLAIDDLGLMKLQFEILKLTPVELNFKEIYKNNSIFNIIFPRTKTEMNHYAMCEDLYDFYLNMNKDYSLYKSLRTYVNQTKAKVKSEANKLTKLEKSVVNPPNYLNFDDLCEKYVPKTKTSENPKFQRLTDTYFKIDFKGYKSDARFSNMIDDSLHVSYAAHCDYFITIDDKCHYKAAETYHKLGIETKAMKPDEFVNNLDLLLK
jgi:hypothetical protein